MELHKDELKTGYNAFLKETTQNQKKLRLETASSTPTSTTSELSTVSAETLILAGNKGTRRRRTKQMTSSLKQLQINSTVGEQFIELCFD
jgi:hypothetical protein